MEGLLQKLKSVYSEGAEFREGQEEANKGVLDEKRTLIAKK